MTHSPDENCFSFAYSTGTGRYSFEVMAESQEAALAALANARFEGAIVPTSVYDVRQSDERETPA